jgi:HK97 family phage major capsid protein
MADSLAGDLRQHIYQAHADGPRRKSRWVMNLEWFKELRRLDDSQGRVLYHPGVTEPFSPENLLGIPIVVREDGGAPHLEEVT